MKITENKKALCGIVLPENPTPREKFAASELIAYIKKISGTELQITEEFENKIIIGKPSKNKYAKEIMREEEFDELVPGPEGFIIYSDDKNLLLAGSSKNEGEFERGTLYAVYEFLERFLGCSLAVYSNSFVDAGEYIPKNPDIIIPQTRYIKKASDVLYRTAIVQYSNWVANPDHSLNEKFISWLIKNRYNRILTWSSIYEGYKKNGMLEEAEKRGILFSVGHHESIKLFLPPEGNEYFSKKYYETHPEFYKLKKDGTRYFMKAGDFAGQFILCARNQECIKVFAENIVKWVDVNPQVDTICLWPNDFIDDGCVCPECQKYTKTQNYTYFVDRVAKLVNKEKPNVKIDQIAYVDMFDCESEEISSSVIIDESTWHINGLRSVGKPDGSCLINTFYEDALLKWKNAGAQVVYYDYFMGVYGSIQKWMPIADEMQAICKRFVEKGILGLGTQMEVFNLWNNIFNFFTYGRTAYDTGRSLEDNLELFTRIFGDAASLIKEIILYGERVIDGQTNLQIAGEYLINHIDKERVYSLYEKALKIAKTPRERNNIRLMRMVFRYSDLEATNPKLDIEGIVTSKSSDDSGELWYMHENFDSFQSGKEGYGIAIAVKKQSNNKFEPNYWYIFE